jgi:hypothetical protein
MNLQVGRIGIKRSTLAKAAILLVSFAAFLSIAATGREFYLFAPSSVDATTLYAQRFEELRKFLPPHGVVGYVSDEPGDEGAWSYYQAQYALSPTIVARTSERQTVVGNFRDPNAIQKILREEHLTAAKDFGNGVLLLTRRLD